MNVRPLIAAAVVVAVIAVVLSLAGDSTGASPKARFQAFKGAMVDRNFEKAWDMLSTRTQSYFDRQAAERMKKFDDASGGNLDKLKAEADMLGIEVKELTGRKLFVSLYKTISRKGEKEWKRLSTAEFSRVEDTGDEKNPADGDRAKVFIKSEGAEQPKPLTLIREQSDWRVELDAEE